MFRVLKVMPSHSSMSGHIKLFSLLNMFQDTAELAVEHIEGNIDELYAKGFAWIVTKYEISILGELPKISDTFALETFHDPFHSYNTLRMFRLILDGNEVLTAKTSWILIDTNSGKPVKPIAHIPCITKSLSCKEIHDTFTEIPDVIHPETSQTLQVSYHDIDYNQHVNHAVYFKWVYDIFNRSGKYPTHLCASFRSGAKLGENITIQCENGAFSVLREGSQRPCAKFFLED